MSDKVTELLTRYLAYKHAVNVYERHKPRASAGVAQYEPMPGRMGAPELFFDIVGKPADMGFTSLKDHEDYINYKIAVNEIEGALATITEEQQSVIQLKWMQDVTLKQIAVRKKYSLATIKRNHKMGIAILNYALRFTEVPDIEIHKTAKVSTF